MRFFKQESEITVAKIYNRNEKFYEVVYEISTVLDDFKKLEQIHNHFIEKLDKCVIVQEPKIFQSPLRLENIKLVNKRFYFTVKPL